MNNCGSDSLWREFKDQKNTADVLKIKGSKLAETMVVFAVTVTKDFITKLKQLHYISNNDKQFDICVELIKFSEVIARLAAILNLDEIREDKMNSKIFVKAVGETAMDEILGLYGESAAGKYITPEMFRQIKSRDKKYTEIIADAGVENIDKWLVASLSEFGSEVALLLDYENDDKLSAFACTWATTFIDSLSIEGLLEET